MSPVLTPEPDISTEYETPTIHQLPYLESKSSSEDNEYFIFSRLLEESQIHIESVLKVSQLDMEDETEFQITDKQIDLISMANDLFKGNKSLEGKAREILHRTFLRTVKRKPTLPG